jgi:hypothetical protein
MAEELAKEEKTEIVLNIYDLPKTVKLRLPDGKLKAYTIKFAARTTGLYLDLDRNM